MLHSSGPSRARPSVAHPSRRLHRRAPSTSFMGSLRSHPYGIELHPVTGIARITCKQEEPSAPSPPAPTTTSAATVAVPARAGRHPHRRGRGHRRRRRRADGAAPPRLAGPGSRHGGTRSTRRQSRQAAAKTAPPESAVTTPATTPTSSTPTATTSKPCTTAVRRGPSSPSSSHPRWIEAAGAACGGPP